LYGPGLAICDFNLGILYMLAVSSLATYGILLAGWSANNKYAFLGSKWPNIKIILCFKQTISGKHKDIFKYLYITLFGTIIVRSFMLLSVFQAYMVKIQLKMCNPQVTKALSSWVDTSEAIRLLYKPLCPIFVRRPVYIYKSQSRNYKSFNHPTNPKGINKKWNQWLAGLIDGDGSFYLTKKGYASLEITMDLRDEHALYIIKNVYGGSVKLVSGQKAIRYSLRHKEGFLALVRDVNGEIRNSYRLMQLNKICLKYDISTILPNKLTYDNGWLSGLFDSDGSIAINKTTGQVSITITQKTKEMLEHIVEIYGGSIYIDRTSNNYKWYISNKETILNFIEYIKSHPSRSMKKNRLHLLPRILELRQLGALKATADNKPLLYKSWAIIMEKFAKFEI
jgi:hypothetical protein